MHWIEFKHVIPYFFVCVTIGVGVDNAVRLEMVYQKRSTTTSAGTWIEATKINKPMPAAPGVPMQSCIQVLSLPNVAHNCV